MSVTWTVFKRKRKDPETKQWNTELFFVMGSEKSFEGIDLNTDWRFCEVKDKREKAVLLGNVDLKDEDWPISYPLLLKNGTEILGNYKETDKLMNRIFGSK